MKKEYTYIAVHPELTEEEKERKKKEIARQLYYIIGNKDKEDQKEAN